MIKIGIIGLGGIAYWLHVPGIKKLTDKFELVAAADTAPWAGDRAKELGVPKLYADYRELLADKSIDAVIISSPHDLHVEHCVAAFEAGKHVFVEKPIARTVEEGEQIIAASKKAGKILMIGLNERYSPVHTEMKRRIDAGELGEIKSARVDHYQNFNPAPDSWWRSKERVGGGCVIGSGIHRLDLLRWYMGEPEEVFAHSVDMPERLEAEACVNASIRFKSGAIADFVCNWAIFQFIYYESLSICGKDGLMYTDGSGLKIGLRDVENGALKDVQCQETLNMHNHFAHCIETGETPLTSGEEGLKTLKLVLAIYKSIETGKPVKMA